MTRLVPESRRRQLVAAGALVVLAGAGWLLVDRDGGVLGAALRLGTGAAPVVSIPPDPPSPAGVMPAPPSPPVPAGAPPPRAPREAPRPGDPAPERYALESGPFASSETADRLEDALNRLGHGTVRVRRQAGEDPGSAAGYHLRYGRFPSRSQAQTLHDELDRNGIKSRVVKIR